MNQQLSQCDVEWLRCLTVSQRLTPMLPEDVLKRFEDLGLVAISDTKRVITESGADLLCRR